VFEAYHADPAVSRIIEKYFIIVDVDIAKNPGGKEMYEKYGAQRGVPAWTVLDVNEKVLADSLNGKDNVGLPFQPKEIEHYVTVLKKTCPKITDDEIDVLTKKLKDLAGKKLEEAKKKAEEKREKKEEK
jgi:hypothetical protein